MSDLPTFIRGLLASGAAQGWQRFGSGSQWDAKEIGQDIGLAAGTPIPASAGVVIAVSPWCTDAIVRERLPDGTILSVGHVTPAVVPGQQVQDGTILGSSAGLPSSCSSGPHVEFQVQPGGGSQVDPVAWLHGTTRPGGAVRDLVPVALIGLGLWLLWDLVS